MTYETFVIQTDTYELLVENRKPEAWVHCTVHKWSKDTYLALMDEWAEVLELLRELGFDTAVAYAPDIKTLKFHIMFGFLPIREDTFEAGTFYRSELRL